MNAIMPSYASAFVAIGRQRILPCGNEVITQTVLKFLAPHKIPGISNSAKKGAYISDASSDQSRNGS